MQQEKHKLVVNFLQYRAECSPSVICKSLKSSMISVIEGAGILVFQPISVPIRTREPSKIGVVLLKVSGGRPLSSHWVFCFVSCFCLLSQQALLTRARVNSSHNRAIISQASTVGDSFLGVQGVGWGSYLLKSTSVVSNLKTRLVRVIALMKLPWAVC